jgi:hypothetical protein
MAATEQVPFEGSRVSHACRLKPRRDSVRLRPVWIALLIRDVTPGSIHSAFAFVARHEFIRAEQPAGEIGLQPLRLRLAFHSAYRRATSA